MKSLEELLKSKPEPIKLTPLLIAQFFISKGGNIDHLKLQKLVYYAQAWFVSIYPDKEPLFDEPIEAWSHGPVVRSVYNRFRKYGMNRLENANYLWDEENNRPYVDIINRCVYCPKEVWIQFLEDEVSNVKGMKKYVIPEKQRMIKELEKYKDYQFIDVLSIFTANANH